MAVHALMDSFVQQLFTELILHCARHCSKYWDDDIQTKWTKVCFCGASIIVENIREKGNT